MDRSASSASPRSSHRRRRVKTASSAQPTENGGPHRECDGFETYPFHELCVRLDHKERVFWCWLNPRGRASFTIALLEECRILQRAIRARAVSGTHEDAGFDYMVLGSRCAEAFNLGGDLALLQQLVHDRNRDGLRRYAELCVDVIRDNALSYRKPINTIANVTGDCLGAGFEAALSCDVIIAEEHVKFGFPEILFGLFPGMGAINFLSRRVGWRHTEQFLLRGRTYSAKDLHNVGLVDRVVARGQGDAETWRYIAQHKNKTCSTAEFPSAMRHVQPFNETEFKRVMTLWVDTAMRLSRRDLRHMLKIAEGQEQNRRAIRRTQSADAV